MEKSMSNLHASLNEDPLALTKSSQLAKPVLWAQLSSCPGTPDEDQTPEAQSPLVDHCQWNPRRAAITYHKVVSKIVLWFLKNWKGSQEVAGHRAIAGPHESGCGFWVTISTGSDPRGKK